MKKIISCLFIMIFTFGLFGNTLADEIEFRGLPWGSSIKEYEKTYNVKDGMLISKDSEPLLRVSKRLDDTDPQILDYGTSDFAGWVSILFNPDIENGLKVFGHSVSIAYAFFTYGIDKSGNLLLSDNDCNLYLAEYMFDTQNGAKTYDDIKIELDSIYGDGQEKLFYSRTLLLDQVDGSKYIDAKIYKCFYYGDNQTICMIEKAMNGDECFSLSLVYANKNGDVMIDSVLQKLAH